MDPMVDPLDIQIEGREVIGGELSLAPLIDVTLLLLIFFMLTSTIIRPEAVELTLPGSSTAESSVPSSLTVSLDAQGVLRLDGTPMDAELLGATLRTRLAEDPELSVELRTDNRLAVQDLLDAMDLLRSNGALNISLATVRPTVQPTVRPAVPQTVPPKRTP